MANWFATAPEEQLKGKTAIIMGGGSGIGKATAEQFAAAGANIMVCGVPEQICLDTAEELRAAGGKAVGVVCDGTDANQVQAMIDKTVAEFGDIDILISTAGISLPRMNAMDATEADWDKIFAVNAKAELLPRNRCCSFHEGKRSRRQDGTHLFPAWHLRYGEHCSLQHHQGSCYGYGSLTCS